MQKNEAKKWKGKRHQYLIWIERKGLGGKSIKKNNARIASAASWGCFLC
jgi:hypothetical protein